MQSGDFTSRAAPAASVAETNGSGLLGYGISWPDYFFSSLGYIWSFINEAPSYPFLATSDFKVPFHENCIVL